MFMLLTALLKTGYSSKSKLHTKPT